MQISQHLIANSSNPFFEKLDSLKQSLTKPKKLNNLWKKEIK